MNLIYIFYFLLFVLILFCINYLIKLIKKPTTTESKIEKTISKTIQSFIKKEDLEKIKVITDEKELFSLAELHHYGKFGVLKDFNKAIDGYHTCIESCKENSNKYIGLCHLGLARLYEEESKNINISLVLKHYLKALECGYEEAIIHIGLIYLNGIHPYYLSDKILAGRLFSTFINFSPTIQPWCKLYLQQINDIFYQDLDNLKQNDIEYRNLPSDIINRIQNSLHSINTIFPYKTTFNQSLLKNFDEDEDLNINIILERLPVQQVRNDTQNVHDHAIQNIGKQIIDVLETNTNLSTDYENNMGDFMGIVKNSNLSKQYPHIKKVCNSFGDAEHSKYEKSEKDVFNLVWSKVKNNKDMHVMFVDNINSCVENENVVCSTGKIMRMLSTLDVIDKETPDLKPEWMIKDEIAQTISKTIKDLNEKDKKDYESDEDRLSERVRLKLKKKISTKCKTDYKDIIDSEILDTYLNDYFEYI